MFGFEYYTQQLFTYHIHNRKLFIPMFAVGILFMLAVALEGGARGALSFKIEPRAVDLTMRIRSAEDDLIVMKGRRIQV
jgi:hypothetical protein